jgi:hypothetical protein
MATTIEVFSDLKIWRCDARCHEARNPDCHCICGGAFHGVGSAAAVEDRFDLTDQEILKDLQGNNLRVFRKPEVMELF